MPELPDIELYLHALSLRVLGQPLLSQRVFVPFLVKTHLVPIGSLVGRSVERLSRLGKRIVWHFGDDCLVMHLMISGRLLWDDQTKLEGKAHPFRPGGKATLAQLNFPTGRLLFTEVSTKHRASIYVLPQSELHTLDPGGVEPLTIDFERFDKTLRSQNRSLKRTLTDPQIFSGIGNAYSDEILHHAKLSPIALTLKISEPETRCLFESTQFVLAHWTDKLRREFGTAFPGKGKITAFRPDFAVHGKYGSACPVCGYPVQRVRLSENEWNYCAHCQTGGKLLADRALSLLLKSDYPKTVDELLDKEG